MGGQVWCGAWPTPAPGKGGQKKQGYGVGELKNERRNKMSIIYEPSGRANEYAKLAANLYKGCTHGCRYCFGPSSLFKTKENYFEMADPKKDVLSKLEKDCQKLNGNCPEILLSFIGDVYQHAEMELGLTRAAIKILISHNLPFTILTHFSWR